MHRSRSCEVRTSAMRATHTQFIPLALERDLVLLISSPSPVCVRYPPVSIAVQPMLHSRKTFWPQRWYWIGTRIDSTKLAKIKAGTTKIQKHCVEDSCVALKFECKETCMFGWGAKKGSGNDVLLTHPSRQKLARLFSIACSILDIPAHE